MKLYLISQKENADWDTYDSAVVAAPDEETAREMDPGELSTMMDWSLELSYWCSGPEHVKVEYLGEGHPFMKQCVICASYNSVNS